MQQAHPDVSIVVPMYNEAEGCEAFFEAIVPVLEACAPHYEIICINDGSRDNTFEMLLRARGRNARIHVINLSRNFGKEAALTAGLDYSRGRAVIPIDADLQDPPGLIPEMLKRWRDGAQVVLARRVDRSSDSVLKRWTAAAFYGLFAKLAKPGIPQNVGDFRLMDRVVVDALKELPERSRFMKGLFAWVGFRQVEIEYTRQPRAQGDTKFNYWKLWNFALEGIFSFSAFPLKVWSYFGVAVSFVAVLYMVFLVIETLITGVEVPGYASLMTIMLFMNGMVLINLGALGEYVSRVFVEVKRRPVYIVNELALAAESEQASWEGDSTIRARVGEGTELATLPANDLAHAAVAGHVG